MRDSNERERDRDGRVTVTGALGIREGKSAVRGDFYPKNVA